MRCSPSSRPAAWQAAAGRGSPTTGTGHGSTSTSATRSTRSRSGTRRRSSPSTCTSTPTSGTSRRRGRSTSMPSWRTSTGPRSTSRFDRYRIGEDVGGAGHVPVTPGVADLRRRPAALPGGRGRSARPLPPRLSRPRADVPAAARGAWPRRGSARWRRSCADTPPPRSRRRATRRPALAADVLDLVDALAGRGSVRAGRGHDWGACGGPARGGRSPRASRATGHDGHPPRRRRWRRDPGRTRSAAPLVVRVPVPGRGLRRAGRRAGRVRLRRPPGRGVVARRRARA